jgi:hypothetical protein
MTSRRWAALVVLCVVTGLAGVAQAGGRKRVVVLEFEGPKSEQFHAELVKLIKKTHTVVSTDKWNGTAEELGASGVSEKNLKKVAKKLKVDAVVEGKIEKRRDEFIIKLKLHQGKTGELVGSPIGTKAGGPRIEGKAQRELNDELIGAIDNVEPNRAAGAPDDEDDKPAKKLADDDRPAKKVARHEDDEDKPAHRGFSKKSDAGRDAESEDAPRKKKVDDEDRPARRVAKADDEDALPPKKAKKRRHDDDEDAAPRKRKKRVASEDDEGVEAEAGPALTKAEQLTPAERALDAMIGMTLTARRLSFQFRSGFTAPTPGYKGNPVGGAMLDATFYPLAFGHTRRDIYKNIGVNVMYDRVLKIDSKDSMGNVLDTKASRWAVGGVFRYPISNAPDSIVVGGTLSYGKQLFRIANAVDIPSVNYSIYEPGVLARLPIGKLTFGLDAGVLIINDTGQLQDQQHYGTTTLIGYEGELSADYMLTSNIFLRAAFRAETIRFKFEGNGALTTAHDGDPMTVDVRTGQDNYFGGFVTAGYVY